MSATESKARTFKELSDGAIFYGPDGEFYKKMGGDSLLLIKPTAKGWIGYGTTSKWNREWQLDFHPLSDEEVRSLVRGKEVRDPLEVLKIAWLVAVVALLTLFLLGGLVWYLFVH